MPTTADALVAIRDAAHLNQHALTLVATELRGQFDSVRSWDDSPTKQSILKAAGRTITGYDNAQREAQALRDRCIEELAAMNAVVPDLPVTGAGASWSQQDW